MDRSYSLMPIAPNSIFNAELKFTNENDLDCLSKPHKEIEFWTLKQQFLEQQFADFSQENVQTETDWIERFFRSVDDIDCNRKGSQMVSADDSQSRTECSDQAGAFLI